MSFMSFVDFSQLNLHNFEFRNLCTWLYDTVIIEYRKEKILHKYKALLHKTAMQMWIKTA